MTFGDYLADKRKAADLTLAKLGALTDLSAQFLNDLEHEKRTPSEATLARLASAYEMDVNILKLRAGLLPVGVQALLEELDDAAVARVLVALRAAAEKEVEQR